MQTNSVRSRNATIYLAWRDVQDYIGFPANTWPKKIRQLFWTPNLKYFQRFLVTVFSYMNGLQLHQLLNWLHLMGCLRDQAAENHVASLWKSYLRGHNGHHYAFDLRANCYMRCDGQRRYYIHHTLRWGDISVTLCNNISHGTLNAYNLLYMRWSQCLHSSSCT